MTHQVKDCVEELVAGESWMLTFTNEHGKVIGDGPGWKAPGNYDSIDNPLPPNELVQHTDPFILDYAAVVEDITGVDPQVCVLT